MERSALSLSLQHRNNTVWKLFSKALASFYCFYSSRFIFFNTRVSVFALYVSALRIRQIDLTFELRAGAVYRSVESLKYVLIVMIQFVRHAALSMFW